jgi:hypothetical protein
MIHRAMDGSRDPFLLGLGRLTKSDWFWIMKAYRIGLEGGGWDPVGGEGTGG